MISCIRASLSRRSVTILSRDSVSEISLFSFAMRILRS